MRKIFQLSVLSSALLALFASGKLYGVTGNFYNESPLKMALVLPTNGLVPNTTVWIGWWIKRERGWHTYWKHPGNVGLTPKLEWILPDGFIISDLLHPLPKRVQMAGVKAYGHYGETLYLTQLEVPDVPVGMEVKIKAKASWMVCSNVCLPQYAELSIDLSVQDEAKPDGQWDALFGEFLRHRPDSFPQRWKLHATELGNFTKLSVSNAQLLDGEEVYLFGGDYLVCSDSKQRLRTTGSGFELLVPKPTWPKENPTHLNGLLRIGSAENANRYYPLNLPLN